MRPFLLLALPAAAAAAPAAGGEWVVTPFGRKRRECVVPVPSGTHVGEDADGLLLSHTERGAWRYDPPAHCAAEENQPPLRAPKWGSGCDIDPTLANCSCGSPPCTCDALPCNSWMDNAGLWTHPQAIGGFSSVYTVPSTPPDGTGPGQTLFYFIGTENTDGMPRHGQPGKSGRTILQPVLTYDPSGWCSGSSTGWCMSSWNCCPKGATTHSDYIMDINPGDTYLGLFNRTDPNTYEVVSRSTTTGQETTLKADAGDRVFNWADVTLEVYSITGCDQFATGAMTFGDLKLWDKDMKPIEADASKWLLTKQKPCKGTVTASGDAITVTHGA